MNSIMRKRQILQLLKEQNAACTMETLCQKLYCSRSTIRRDLINLEEEGMIQRHHGGVSLVMDSASENSVNIRRMANPEKKAAIAKLFQKYLRDNMVLFMDSSSTVGYCIPYIKQKREMTIITNGIHAASQFNTLSDFKCYLCPGILKYNSLSVIGEYALGFLDNFSAQVAVLSCKAINEQGFFEGDDSQALIKRKMIKNSNFRILLCDNTKENSSGYFKLANFDEIDFIISNSYFSDKLMNVIQQSKAHFLCPENYSQYSHFKF